MSTTGEWPLGAVTIKVLDLERQLAFYRAFGFIEIDRSTGAATLGGADGRPLLHLHHLAVGRSRPPRTAGLFHFAILLPDEGSLGSFLRHARLARLPFVGAGDHLVSQALYYEDPEGNGIEIYADRPREGWTYEAGQVAMATLPVDMERLTSLPGPEWAGFPSGTVLGHMHLTVADLDRSQHHYEGLGMTVTANWGPFRFMAWDGYHHHLGLNLVNGRGAAPVAADVAGIKGFGVSRPGFSDGNDPDGIGVFV